MSMKTGKRWLTALMAVFMITGAMPAEAYAREVSVSSDKITRGKTGKNMTVSFQIDSSGTKIDNAAIAFDVSGGEIWDESEEDRTMGYAFPFENTASLPTPEKPRPIGTINGKKTVSLTGRVRSDLSEGYYKVPVIVLKKSGNGDDYSEYIGRADLQVWISKSSGNETDESDENKTYDFVLGEGQNAPHGTYPEVMNFTINLRNNSPATVYNVKASILLEADSTKFPFQINDANYDRTFEKLSVDETVPLGYSFAIRADSYTGYYPINMEITYSNSSTGEELKTFETSFYVHVNSKPKKEDYEEFNEHARTKARLIVDGFATTPETIIAGESFDLRLMIKNASSSVSASDILLTVESEKVSDSPVFTTESGSTSVAISSLGVGATKEVKFRLSSRAGVDQRSYGLTIKAKFDSPEFKNAEESMSVDIPVKQIPKLNTGTFEIMPESITVGGESNVMFGINNTGKVMLYNVMVKFEADSIQDTDTYVGNIKPGETGNVDCMLTGAAPTADDGKIRVIISYEDENGEASEVEKELSLLVMEDMSSMEDMNVGNFDNVPMEEPGFLEKYQKQLLPAALGAVAVLTIILIVIGIRHRKHKKEQESFEDDEE